MLSDTIVDDLRKHRVSGRSTTFRIKQRRIIQSIFATFVPGGINDPTPGKSFIDYLDDFVLTVNNVGQEYYGEEFRVDKAALAKVRGDIYEYIVAVSMWNATVNEPVAILKLPRGYNFTRLFEQETTAKIRDHDDFLALNGTIHSCPTPDILGIRVDRQSEFSTQLSNLNDDLDRLENAYKIIEGTVSPQDVLFGCAVKLTPRSDRVHQSLVEANSLRYLIEHILAAGPIRFYAILGTFAGTDVKGIYQNASLISLIAGQPAKAIDRVHLGITPFDVAQMIREEFAESLGGVVDIVSS